MSKIFTEDCLQTFISKVEAVLNSQPLIAISNDINDLEPLMTNHLLTGGSLMNYSPWNFYSKEIGLRKKWYAIQAAANMFWVWWKHEYLPLLSTHKKWNLMPQHLKVGDLVLINTSDIQRSNWPLGLLLETYQGPNDIVWTVKLKTWNGEIISPESKLAFLQAMVK